MSEFHSLKEPNSKWMYSYPIDLAHSVVSTWRRSSGQELTVPHEMLERFIAGAYHASMLQEEARAISFRAILASPASFDPMDSSINGCWKLEFSETIAFTPSVLRRLSIAMPPEQTLLCVWEDNGGNLEVWGLINSGALSLRNLQVGGKLALVLPNAPLIYVRAPGTVEVYKAHTLVATLKNGIISESRADLFKSQWIANQFLALGDRMLESHISASSKARESSGEIWAPFQGGLQKRIAERMIMRVLSVLQESQHGGTIVFLPEARAGEKGAGDFIEIRYSFSESKERFFFPDLLTEMFNRFARIFASKVDEPNPITWEDFENTTDTEMARLDERLFNVANFVAGLAATDGAVVFTMDHELLGFGGMISGRLATIKSVDRALDIEGSTVVEENTSNVGSRHLSAYRLAGGLPGSIVIVISQDGGARFVGNKGGRVTYWEHL